ncbi:MAG: ATP-dependent DNA helicase RecG [Propionibacteriaceae bacterium]|jgi:ATP-dependent DNA helicase RecG|nr:ATP-dependent DNA helicase RecG [Propionibacteriaceae bacterium]
MSQWETEAFRRLGVPLDRVLGAATAKAFQRLDCVSVGDLVHLLPRHLMSGTDLTDISSLVRENRGSEEYVALKARVASMEIKGQAPRQRIELILSDGHGRLTATFFGRPNLIMYWSRVLSASDVGIFAGKLGWFNMAPQLAHPAFVMITPDGFVGSAQNTKMATRVAGSSFIGLYPQTAKLPTWTVAESIDLCLATLDGAEDPLPQWVREAAEQVDMRTALEGVHHPLTREAYDEGVERLLFDEAFAAQVAMAYRRADTLTHTAVPRSPVVGGLVDAFDARLPFTRTPEQVEVGHVLDEELERSRPMQRLLQGEVGSGKTVVAVRAMLRVVDVGGQAVLLAPTEVLAQQHVYTISALLGDLGQPGLLGAEKSTEIVLLTGSMPAAAKTEALAKIASGQAGIIVGTHALLSGSVQFADLGLVVVDEQHRFGVEQRNSLSSRGQNRPHILVMTATPIPRSVAMTVFGDLDISTFTRVPEGRAEVTTTVVDALAKPAWVDRAWARVREEVAKGRQVYIVAPRIDPTDTDQEGTSVVELYEQLNAGPLARLHVGLLHGRLSAAEKTKTMADFAAGSLDVLIATSMIEVGLDQPNATMMVICDAERFGISQLHQLRGRIGRGQWPGVCLLLTKAEETTPARERLETVASTRDGFALAQTDLAQRREGDVLGLRQHGRRSSLRLLRVIDHADIIDVARGIAEEVVRRDPAMTDPGVADFVREIESRAEADFDEST